MVLYATYLVYVGLFLTLGPWSPAWSRVTDLLPLPWSCWARWPAVRGALTALGLLHLALLAAELLGAGRPAPARPDPPPPRPRDESW